MTAKWATKNLVAPKGIFVKGDTLWVSDNKNVHSFDSKTGDWKTTLTIPKAVFLNDVTVDADDNVYVTDTGLAAPMKPSAFALYKFVKGKG
jgi:outer membrane protein assembly factor BamB